MNREGLIDLNEAVQHPGKKLTLTVKTELASEEDIDLLAPVTGTLHVVSTGNLLIVEGTFETRAVLECARCGAPIETPVSFNMYDPFAVEGVPSYYSHEGHARVVEDEPEPLFSENALILDHYVRQGLLVNIPTQPLCSGSWDGPCQNEIERHDEEPQLGHPAFQKLRSLDKGEAV